METVVHLDTHVALWLVTGRPDLLPRRAIEAVESYDCMISPAVLLELEYLHEIGRTNRSGEKIVEDLAEEIGLQVSDIPFGHVIQHALRMSWTRDPFDRIITATAQAAGAPLLTKDETIRRHYRKSLWE